MSDPFHNLKHSMKKTVFKDFTFSDERKEAVKETIREKQSQPHLQAWKEETILAVFESIQHEAKHGYDISTQLFKKGELRFEHNEGQLYTLLHLLENKGILSSKWIAEKKHYSLTKKGKKYLVASKQEHSKQRFFLKHLLEEASL
ncbi:PadR family transcriptional regulator [Alkalihalobacterium chitinilyticum]|uniref:PadR family transcriptional regulator n=1 Tax=Alkalihalobacterium chitinilyticum TaxID=2980103 RepID=A0ABT5VKZ8_9BACI|nr:PadR family transcriptional regulator [Alkalihalobacterium chitinilyticum]MDE5416122.1 PadR family transcriptional regulator [Alkalihalobacterium chitinilyticum]